MELKQGLQRNILTLAVTGQEKTDLIKLFSLVETKHLETKLFRDIFNAARFFFEKHDKSPGIEHVGDIIEDQQGRLEPAIAELLTSIQEHSSKISPNFIIESLEKELHRQDLKIILVDTYEKAANNNSDPYALEEEIRNSLRKIQKETTAPISLTSVDAMKGVLSSFSEPGEFLYGVPPLDYDPWSRPRRGQLAVVLSVQKAGKTRFLIGAEEFNRRSGKKILALDMEAPQDEGLLRRYQCRYGLGRRPEESFSTVSFITDGWGNLIDSERRTIKPSLSVVDPKIEDFLAERMIMDSGGTIDLLSRPPGTLKIAELDAFLRIKKEEGESYDMLTVDNPKLFQLRTTNSAERASELIAIYTQLKAMAVEYNMFILAVHHATVSGYQKTWLTLSDIVESKGIIQPVDALFAISATDYERNVSVCRMHAPSSIERHGKHTKRWIIVQDPLREQFCSDWAYLEDFNNYEDSMIGNTGNSNTNE